MSFLPDWLTGYDSANAEAAQQADITLRGINATNGVTTPATVTTSNIVFSSWRWTDAVASGFSLGAGSNAPGSIQANPTDAEIPALGYGHGDDATFSIQSIHSLATTNAANPNFYFEPHVHCMTTSTNAGTGATWRMKMDVAFVNGSYTNVAVYARTNTITLTNAYSHYICSFGNITNNLLSGKNSVIFRGFVERIAPGAGTNDVGSGQIVTLDSFDVHVPFDQLGSSGQTSN